VASCSASLIVSVSENNRNPRGFDLCTGYLVYECVEGTVTYWLFPSNHAREKETAVTNASHAMVRTEGRSSTASVAEYTSVRALEGLRVAAYEIVA